VLNIHYDLMARLTFLLQEIHNGMLSDGMNILPGEATLEVASLFDEIIF